MEQYVGPTHWRHREVFFTRKKSNQQLATRDRSKMTRKPVCHGVHRRFLAVYTSEAQSNGCATLLGVQFFLPSRGKIFKLVQDKTFAIAKASYCQSPLHIPKLKEKKTGISYLELYYRATYTPVPKMKSASLLKREIYYFFEIKTS